MTTSMLLLFPLTFISNIFVDPKTMPGFMQTIVSFNPGDASDQCGTRVDAWECAGGRMFCGC